MKKLSHSLLTFIANVGLYLLFFVLAVWLLNYPFSFIFHYIEIHPYLMGVFVAFIALILFILVKVVISLFKKKQ